MRTYTCNSCGAEIIVNDETSFTTCLYCGNSIAISQKEFADLNVKKIIPFSLEKEEVINKYSKDYGKIIDAKKVFIPVRYCSFDFDYLLYYEYVIRSNDDDGHDRYIDTQDLYDGSAEKEIVFGDSKVHDVVLLHKIAEKERLDFDPVLVKDVSIENVEFDSNDVIKSTLEKNVKEYAYGQIHREITNVYSENYFISDVEIEDFTTLIPVYILKTYDGRIINVPGVEVSKDKGRFSLSNFYLVPGAYKRLFVALILIVFPIVDPLIKYGSIGIKPGFIIYVGIILLFLVLTSFKRNPNTKRSYKNYKSTKYSYNGDRKEMKY